MTILTLSNTVAGGGAGAKVVDMSLCHPNITRALSNPLVVVPIPSDKTNKKARQYILDLTMVTDSISIDCVFKDGFGTHNFISGTTNYEKLMGIFVDGGTGLLTWGLDGNTITVKSASLSFKFEAGFKDIVYCSMKLYPQKNLTAPK